MATPLSNSAWYSTRSNSRGLLVPIPEPERVYRRRANRLAPRRLLASLGEEAISDIHLLFNNPLITSPMDAIYQPCDFPDKALEKLPSFQGNNVVSAKAHVRNFNLCISKWCNAYNHEDVKMKLFVLSLEEDALDWFTEQDDNKFNTLQEILDGFNERWRDRKEAHFLLVALHASQKNENETMEEFNKKFNDLFKILDKNVIPPDDSI